MYILPAIDILDSKVVRLQQGNYAQVTSYSDDPVRQAEQFAADGAKWVHIVDLGGSKSGQSKIGPIVTQIAQQTSLNIEVGGGIRSAETIETLFNAGATRVVLGSVLAHNYLAETEAPPAATEQPAVKFDDFISQFGPAQIVAGVDARAGKVSVSGWTEDTAIEDSEFLSYLNARGFEHLIYTDINKDGMQTGVDVAHYRVLAKQFKHAIIASGGVATLDDLAHLQQLSQNSPDTIEGAIIGKALYEGKFTLQEAMEYA